LPSFIRKNLQREENKGIELTGGLGTNYKAETRKQKWGAGTAEMPEG
jgi:hypothetical protein